MPLFTLLLLCRDHGRASLSAGILLTASLLVFVLVLVLVEAESTLVERNCAKALARCFCANLSIPKRARRSCTFRRSSSFIMTSCSKTERSFGFNIIAEVVRVFFCLRGDCILVLLCRRRCLLARRRRRGTGKETRRHRRKRRKAERTTSSDSCCALGKEQ